MTLRAVLFDVDFTLARPGPELGPEGYVRAGARHGLHLAPERYDDARDAAFLDLRRHPELEHDDEIWFRFTERIVRGMGGDAPSAYDCAVEITRGWERHENFELYDDALPTLAALRAAGLRIGLVSNSARDVREFARPPRARHRRRHQLVPSRQVEAARLDLPRRPRPARGRAGGRGHGRRLDRRRHRRRARARHARDPRRPRRARIRTSSHGSQASRSSGPSSGSTFSVRPAAVPHLHAAARGTCGVDGGARRPRRRLRGRRLQHDDDVADRPRRTPPATARRPSRSA